MPETDTISLLALEIAGLVLVLLQRE